MLFIQSPKVRFFPSTLATTWSAEIPALLLYLLQAHPEMKKTTAAVAKKKNGFGREGIKLPFRNRFVGFKEGGIVTRGFGGSKVLSPQQPDFTHQWRSMGKTQMEPNQKFSLIHMDPISFNNF
jgi:hypothetical protein